MGEETVEKTKGQASPDSRHKGVGLRHVKEDAWEGVASWWRWLCRPSAEFQHSRSEQLVLEVESQEGPICELTE